MTESVMKFLRLTRAARALPSPPPIVPPHLSEALPVFRNIPDLSSEVKILGDVPVATGVISSIWLGEILNGQQVAVKLLTPTRIGELGDQELYIWSHVMPHEHVLPLLGVARLKDSVAFISPYMPGRSLDVQLSECSIPERIRILTEVASALTFLHRKNVAYGNLRLTTIVLDHAKKAYLSSFLFARTDWTEVAKADSIFFPKRDGDAPTPITDDLLLEDDILAFGTLLTLVLSYEGSMRRDQNRLVKRLLQGKFKETLTSPDIPEETWVVAQACWEDSTKRPTMEQVYTKMSKILDALTLNKVDRGTVPGLASNPLKDISPEIKKTSEYPVAGGGYCDLYLGERLGKEKVALKLIRLFGSTEQDKDTTRKRFMSEVQIWADLHHPRILEFYGICEYGTLSMYMVSPFLQNGNIMHYLNNINLNADRRKLLVETAEGLEYLHNRNPPVIHGDLKGPSGNILISDAGTAVLADFGLSRISHEITSSILHGAGSPRWMAPELMTADDTVVGPLRTIQSDVYGYGHIMLEVLSNEKPFFDIRDDLRVLVELIHGRRSARPAGPIASQWLDDVSWACCRQCTAIDPAERPSMNDILKHLQQIFNV